jgi:hypothetical protein
MSANSSILGPPQRQIDDRRCPERVASFQVWQLRPRETKPDGARPARFTVDEAMRVKRLDHVVYDRRSHAKEPPEIGFGWWRAVNLRVLVNEREVLPLLGCERPRVID